MLTTYIQIQNGLKPEHVSEVPLLELEYHQPDADNARIQRIYLDGSLYFLSSSEEQMLWIFITMIRKEGIEELAAIAEAYSRSYNLLPEVKLGKGMYIYRISADGAMKEITVRGVNYGNYARLGDIDNIINANLVPISN